MKIQKIAVCFDGSEKLFKPSDLSVALDYAKQLGDEADVFALNNGEVVGHIDELGVMVEMDG